jgi:hypothetical protein
MPFSLSCDFFTQPSVSKNTCVIGSSLKYSA